MGSFDTLPIISPFFGNDLITQMTTLLFSDRQPRCFTDNDHAFSDNSLVGNLVAQHRCPFSEEGFRNGVWLVVNCSAEGGEQIKVWFVQNYS